MPTTFPARQSSRLARGLPWLFFALVVVAPRRSHAIYEWESSQSNFGLYGSAKLFPTFTHTRPIAGMEAEDFWLTLGSLRLSLDAGTHESIALDAAYHLFPVLRDGDRAGTGFGTLDSGLVQPRGSALRIVDFDHRLVDRENVALDHNLDRLNLLLMFGGWDLHIGRQAIGHGSARIFSSTDIFSPFSPATLDNEFKQGVDAARLTLPWGEDTEFELIAVGHRDKQRDGIYLARFGHSFTGFDASVYDKSSYRTPTLGLDASGDLFDATFYAEVFYRHWSQASFERNAGRTALGSLPRRREHLVRATAGVHTYFAESLSAMVELHYNGSGARVAADYFESALAPEWQHGESYLLGRSYAGAGLSYEITEILTANLMTIANLRDPSALLGPSVSWDSSDNTSLGVGALVGVGKSVDGLEPRSEFGLYPYTAYADARWYF